MLDYLNRLTKYKKIPFTQKELNPKFAGLRVTTTYGNCRSYHLLGIAIKQTPKNHKLENLDITIA